MDLSVIIVNWNTEGLLRDCLRSVYETIEGLAFEVIVVDNASGDGSVAMLKVEFPQVRRIENYENRGFAAANNQAFRAMAGRYALLLNSDAVLTEGAVRELFVFMEDHPEAVMACGQLLNADGSKQTSVARFPTIRRPDHHAFWTSSRRYQQAPGLFHRSRWILHRGHA
jgi:GT2 family glycosyltransferase